MKARIKPARTPAQVVKAPKKPVRLSELLTSVPTSSVSITAREHREFVHAVELAMDRLGFTKANETTAASERLSERDFSVRINAR